MKPHYLLFLLFPFFITSCKKENQEPFVPTNHLADFKTEKTQIFDLDTISYKKIIGKHGTEIIYSRDLFRLREHEKVQLQLIELYDFKEILYRNIQTLTTDDELLETSGVLKITFTSNGKKLKLKKDEKLIVYPPKGKLKNNDIFLSETDSIGSIKWKITNQNFLKAIVEVGGGIVKEIIIRNDSLINYNENTGNDLLGVYNYDSSINKNYYNDFFIIVEESWDWINIDRFVKNIPKINFKLKDEFNKFSGFDTYIIYKNINSFIYNPKFIDDLLFEDVPISTPTHIIIVGNFENEIYYDKIELKKSMHNSEIQLNMKKTSKENLKKLFDK